MPTALRKLTFLRLLLIFIVALSSVAPSFAAAVDADPAWPANDIREEDQYAAFPLPLDEYEEITGPDGAKPGVMDVIVGRAMQQPFNIAVTAIFILAIFHTFMAGKIMHAAHVAQEKHMEKIRREGRMAKDKPHKNAKDDVCFKATVLHFLGEVEAIFGIWVLVLMSVCAYYYSWGDFTLYIGHDRVFIEPMFVVIIMAIASSRPVLLFAENTLRIFAGLGKGSPAAWWLSVLVIAPILGSFITEPAAMTIAALILLKKFYKYDISPKFAYATLGLLFVNISVGGTLTHFAAPPVLMVAGKWGWDMQFMLLHFGWKAVIAVVIATTLYYFYFRKELANLADAADGVIDGEVHPERWEDREDSIPAWITLVHLGFLGWTVFNAHNPPLFVGGFLFFLAFVAATEHHQNSISLKSPLLVGFFLAALIVHGGLQTWWIEPVIQGLPSNFLMLGSTILTAFNDNAAITYLASTVQGISPAAQHAVVAGAVTGGGLTVIANAPNPAGQSILGKKFNDGISPIGLLSGALLPTIICYAAFTFLPQLGGVAHPPHHNNTDNAEQVGEAMSQPATPSQTAEEN